VSKTTDRIRQKQDDLLEQMGRIRVMRRGTVSQQHYPQRRKRRAGKGATGPYFIWQGYLNGKRFGRRVSGAEAQQLAEAIAQRQRFERLCAEYEALGEAMAEKMRQPPHEADAAKKVLREGEWS